MRSFSQRTRAAAALTLLTAVTVAGCGGSSSSTGAGNSAPTVAKRGGTATVLESAGGIDNLDPGYWYYQTDYEDVGGTTQRTLYGFAAHDTVPKPDLATALPVMSDGGRTLTIHIKPGIHYSPPLQKQTVQAADIKYAMERCFSTGVGNGYAPVYYSQIAGAPATPTARVPSISGIQAPDPSTLIIRTKTPVGVLTDANALALYCTTPIPQSYAAKYDTGSQSTYGQHQVFTGPYMIQGAGTGTVPSSGYQPQRLLVLVRNPSFSPASDPLRPAYLDRIVFKGGYDATVASRQVLSGRGLLSGDYAVPPAPVLKAGLTSGQRSQFHIEPSGGNRYVALNTTIPPLNNVNVRRAIGAALNRTALRLTRGGPAVGTVATHFIPPHVDGFLQAGGVGGSKLDFLGNPNGDLPLAESYMRRAGYPSGRYTGPPLLAIADNAQPASNTALAIESELAQIGIRLTLRQVPHATMLTKFCLVPKSKVAICPNMGWARDFFDAQSMIDPVFNGKNIVPTGNTNVSQANDPTLNAEMDRAEQITQLSRRATVWGALDKAVTAQAFVIPWLWDNEITFNSSDVNGVTWDFNGNTFDLTSTSLK